MIDANYGILITPTVTETGWTGDVEVNIAFTDHPQMNEEENDMLFNVLQMMASSLELMESDLSIAERLSNIVEDRINSFVKEDSEKAQSTNSRVKVEEGDDNVVHLSFAKPAGNA